VHLERDAVPFFSGNGKLDNELMKPGDVLVIESGGGGGYGDPHERPRATVADDVRNGYVTPEAALRDYGLAETELP
jgi:N-methylhydantoinase B